MTTLHALIVEDDAFNLEVLKRLLAAEGIATTGVQRPQQLEEALQSLERLDLVFLDLELPDDVDGYMLLAFLRDEVGVQVPIIAYTMHTNEMSNARQVGFHSFLGKPLRADRFPDQLRRILNNTPVWENK